MVTENSNVESQKLQIKEFDLEQMFKNPTIYFIAKRTSGMTWRWRYKK